MAKITGKFFEFEYIVNGSGTYSIDGVEYKINDNSLYFMTPVNFHSVNMDNTEFYNVMFSADMCNIEILSKLFSLSPTVLTVDSTTNVFLCALLDDLCENCDNTRYASLLLETIVYKISSLALYNENKGISSEIRDAELYILENFKKNITLFDVAQHALFSESHFSRKFAAETGRTFKKYLSSVRLEYAKKLLTFSDMTVMQICSECGFDDYPNFIRRFGKSTGMSPLEYRKRSLSKNK